MSNSEVESPGPISLVGLGYVGASLAAVLAARDCRIHGIDIDTDLVGEINRGACPIEEAGITERFEEGVEAGLVSASTSYESVADARVVLVTVGTPLAEADPDVSAVENAATAIGEYLTPDTLVIFRSTLPAGLTEGFIRETLDSESGQTAGEDYSLAFCPERMAEGSAYDDLTTLPVVVGGLTESCQEAAVEFWEKLGQETVAVSSPTAAELSKLADNWWIDLNIAMANEVALLSEQLGVDAMEVIHAANTLPKGEHNVNILYPGAGVGGSCLVKDPWFVASLGDRHGLSLETPRVSRQVNDRMPAHLVDLVAEHVVDLDSATVAVLGYAFKAGTDDTRNTPAKEIVARLQKLAGEVRVTDPYVAADTIQSETGVAPHRLPEALEDADALVIVTGHDQYRSLTPDDLTGYVGTESYTVVDGRFVFEPMPFKTTETQYVGIGRGGQR